MKHCLSGQIYSPQVVNSRYHDHNLISYFDHIFHIGHPIISQLTNMYQSLFTREYFYHSTKVKHACHFPCINHTCLHFFGQAFDQLNRLLSCFASANMFL